MNNVRPMVSHFHNGMRALVVAEAAAAEEQEQVAAALVVPPHLSAFAANVYRRLYTARQPKDWRDADLLNLEQIAQFRDDAELERQMIDRFDPDCMHFKRYLQYTKLAQSLSTSMQLMARATVARKADEREQHMQRTRDTLKNADDLG